MRRVRAATVECRSECTSALMGRLTDKDSLLNPVSICWIDSNRSCKIRFQFGDIDFGQSPHAGLAVDPHAVVVSEKNLQTFIYVTDTDPLFKQRGELRLGDADSIIFH